MSAPRNAARKPAGQPAKAIPGDKAPIIDTIFEDLIEAHGMVYVACQFIERAEDEEVGYGVYVLRHGIATLTKLLRLTEEVVLAEKARKHGGAS